MKILKNFGLFLLFYGEHGEVPLLTSRINYVTCFYFILFSPFIFISSRPPVLLMLLTALPQQRIDRVKRKQ